MWNIFSDIPLHIDGPMSQEIVIDFDMTVKLLARFLFSESTGFKSRNMLNF